MKRNRRNGYTLIELLVVLIMLAFLAAVILPTFQNARLTSQRASCLRNTKQIGDALRQYAADYNQYLPPLGINDVTSSVPPFSRPYGWADALQHYLGNTTVLHCPSQTSYVSIDGAQNGFTDYWMNSTGDALDLKLLAAPTLMVLCGEGNDGNQRTDARYNLRALPSDWSSYIADADNPSRRHFGTANYLFADGHVKMLRPEQIAAFNWSASRATQEAK